MKKQIAFIGSSGGNLYKQGGNDIAGMMKEILAQTKAADMEIAFVQYVLASGSLDTVGPESKASLYTWDGAAVCRMFSIRWSVTFQWLSVRLRPNRYPAWMRSVS